MRTCLARCRGGPGRRWRRRRVPAVPSVDGGRRLPTTDYRSEVPPCPARRRPPPTSPWRRELSSTTFRIPGRSLPNLASCGAATVFSLCSPGFCTPSTGHIASVAVSSGIRYMLACFSALLQPSVFCYDAEHSRVQGAQERGDRRDKLLRHLRSGARPIYVLACRPDSAVIFPVAPTIKVH